MPQRGKFSKRPPTPRPRPLSVQRFQELMEQQAGRLRRPKPEDVESGVTEAMAREAELDVVERQARSEAATVQALGRLYGGKQPRALIRERAAPARMELRPGQSGRLSEWDDPGIRTEVGPLLDWVGGKILRDPILLQDFREAVTGSGVQAYLDGVRKLEFLGPWQQLSDEIALELLRNDSMLAAAARPTSFEMLARRDPSDPLPTLSEQMHEIGSKAALVWSLVASAPQETALRSVLTATKPQRFEPTKLAHETLRELHSRTINIREENLSPAGKQWMQRLDDALDDLQETVAGSGPASYSERTLRLTDYALGRAEAAPQDMREFFRAPMRRRFTEPLQGPIGMRPPGPAEDVAPAGGSTSSPMYPEQGFARMQARLRQEGRPGQYVIVGGSRGRVEPLPIETTQGPKTGVPASGSRYLNVPARYYEESTAAAIDITPGYLAGRTLGTGLLSGDLAGVKLWWNSAGRRYGLEKLPGEQPAAREMLPQVLADYRLQEGMGIEAFQALLGHAGITDLDRGAQVFASLMAGQPEIAVRMAPEAVLHEAMGLSLHDLALVRLHTWSNPSATVEAIRHGGRAGLAKVVARDILLGDEDKVRAAANAVFGEDYRDVARQAIGEFGPYAPGERRGADEIAHDISDGLLGRMGWRESPEIAPEPVRAARRLDPSLLDSLAHFSRSVTDERGGVYRRPPLDLREGEEWRAESYATALDDFAGDISDERAVNWLAEPGVRHAIERSRALGSGRITTGQAIVDAIERGEIAEPIGRGEAARASIAHRVLSTLYADLEESVATPQMLEPLGGLRLPPWVRESTASAERRAVPTGEELAAHELARMKAARQERARMRAEAERMLREANVGEAPF